MKKLISPFLNPYIGPIIVITLVVAYLVIFEIPKYSEKNKKESMTQKAISVVENLKKTRSYYTTYVINDIKKQTDIRINYDHEERKDTIPLPATLVHDLSTILPENDMKIKMFSNYPFPNRKDRVLDEFEKESLAWLVNNPDDIYTKTIEKNKDEKIFKVAVADVFYNNGCVQCHNTRADTPKDDWELGDVRGIIEVTIPYSKEFILSSRQTLYLIAILIIFILALGIHYSVISFIRQKDYKRNKKILEEEVANRTKTLKDTNKLLNEYKKAVDTSAIVSKTNKDGLITYVNDEFIKISQYTRNELLRRSHNIVRHPDMSDEFFKDLWDTINNKKIWKGQIKNRAKDGSAYYVASTIVPILNSDDEIEEFLAIRLDITDVINSQIKAQRADEAKSTFLANISHEIRTPLNAIIGFSDILCKTKHLDTQTKKQANIIQTSANSLLGIINDILDVSKIESGNFEIAIENTDIYYISEHVVELFSKRAIEKHIKLVFDLDNKIPMCLKTDGVRVRQVLSNLLSNAIKFTPEHGKIELNINQVNKDENTTTIRFEVKDTGIGIPKEKLDNVFKPFVQVDHKSNRQFEGTGLGLSISSHIIDSLGSKINIESQVGTGTKFWFDLTLEICDDAIHTNKEYSSQISFKFDDINSDLYHYAKRYLNIFGTINNENENKNIIKVLTSNDLKNSKLQKLREEEPNTLKLILLEYEESLDELTLYENEQGLALPFYASKINDALQELLNIKNEALQIEENIDFDSFEGRVLVAEDNPANQELISFILKNFEVDFDLASNGKEAFDLYRNNSYDMILMDINMPIMDGIEAFNSIRKFESENTISSTPIIALTANAIKGDKEKFLKLGMNDYLSKPINTDELKSIFNKFLTASNKDIKSDKTKEEITKQAEVNTSNEVISTDAVAKKLGISSTVANMIIQKFKDEIIKDLDELNSFIETNDIKNRVDKAHYIKNSCLNMALDDICELLQSLEDSSLSKDDSKEVSTKIYANIENMIKE